MGAISIGLKKKPAGRIAVFEWDSGNMLFVAVDLHDETTTIEAVEDFCERYTDKKVAELELKSYCEGGYKYVLNTRCFQFGSTREMARARMKFN